MPERKEPVSLFVPELDGYTFADFGSAYESFEQEAEYVSLAYAESGGALRLPPPSWDPYGTRRFWSNEYGCWMQRDLHLDT